jgi:molybdopterin biosynthesis enzyme
LLLRPPDDPSILRLEVERLLEQDMVIVSGGVSAGDADHVPAVLEAAGVRPLFHRIAIRLGMQAHMLALHPANSGDLEAGETVLCYPI